MEPRLAFVAGEVSGDLLAGLLLQGLRERWPGLHAVGIGGPAMARQGMQAWWPSDTLAVRGYVEVLRHYRGITRIRSALKARLLAQPPAGFIGVDAPDFNLALETDLKARGIPTVQFVCPSIWAWRAGRTRRIREAVDHVLCLFPFEPALLQAHGIGATYVGHPLASVIPAVVDQAAARVALGLPSEGDVLAVLPGSRASEIDYLAAPFFEAAALVRRARPGLRLVSPVVPALRETVTQAARRAGLGDELLLVEGRSHEVLAACDLTLIASGTATLEAALFRRPMVVAYRMNALSWQIMKRQALQPWVSLPNILLREHAVPELLQHDATPPRLADALLAWLDDPGKMAAVRHRFSTLHETLRRDTARLATNAIEQVLQR